MTRHFTGLIAYPITPLTHDDELDMGVLAHLVHNAARAGVSGITVLATSGAGVTFDRGERKSVVEAAVQAAEGAAMAGDAPIPVYAAVSAASTRQVRQFSQDAERAGAAGLLVAPFSYLPLSDGEVRTLFAEVADATELPLCFYNKPVQTQYDLTPATLTHLANTARVVAVKETMRREHIVSRVSVLRDASGPDFSLGLSSDVQLLADRPDVDAWHTGLAALMPADYAQVWSRSRNGHEQGSGLALLQAVALALSGVRHSVGALHALAGELGVATANPRGPFGLPGSADVQLLQAALS